jgi:hypothetical protein
VSATVLFNHASEVATLSNVFSVNGVPTDPTTITLVVTDPAGTATTYTYASGQLTRTGTGAYTRDVTCGSTPGGLWQYTWIGTGAAVDVVAGTWTTVSTALQTLYCSVEELKSRLGMASTDTADDFELRLAVDSASRWIDDHCGRYFWRGTATRSFIARDWYSCDVDDLVSVTSLATDAGGDGVFETTWTTADYQLLPLDTTSYAETRPYTSIKAIAGKTFPKVWWPYMLREDRVQVVGVFGWPQVPSAVKQAALLLSADLFKLKGAPFGVTAVGDFAMRIRDNTRVMTLLEPFTPVLVA